MQRGSKHNLDRVEYRSRASEFSERGQALPQAKLLDLEVIDIRSMHRQRENLLKYIRENLSNDALCKKYGIHKRTLEKIVSRQTWTHLP